MGHRAVPAVVLGHGMTWDSTRCASVGGALDGPEFGTRTRSNNRPFGTKTNAVGTSVRASGHGMQYMDGRGLKRCLGA